MTQMPGYYEPLLYGAMAFIGLVSCFFGYRLFKLIIISLVALAGAVGLAWLGFTYGDEPVLWSAAGLVVGAILGGVLAMFFYRVAVGLMASLFVALTLLPWLQQLDVLAQVLTLAIACLLAALIATALTNLMIQLASAMLGAILLVHSARYFISGETVYRTTEGEAGWILYLDLDLTLAGVALVLGLVGFLVQRRSAK